MSKYPIEEEQEAQDEAETRDGLDECWVDPIK